MKRRILTLVSIIALVLGLSALLMACDGDDGTEGEKVDYSVTVLSPAETPISGVTVSWVTSQNETAGTATTGADGKATASLPAGTYTIGLSGDALAEYDYDAISVTSKMRNPEIVLSAKRVTYSVTVKDKDGAAAQGVTVTWTKGNTAKTATTNASGKAECELEYGNYTVTLSKLPFGNSYDGGRNVSGAYPSTTFNLRELSGDVVTYSVTVKSAGGLLFKNYNVNVLRGGELWNSGTTNDEGVFEMTSEAGDYTIDLPKVPNGYTYTPLALSADVTSAELVLTSALIGASQASASTRYVIGDIFHDYTFTTSYKMNGAIWSKSVSEILQNKDALIINNWGTGCGNCLTEMPDMQEVYEEYKDKIEIVAVDNYPSSREGIDSVATIEAFVNQYGYTFPMMRDVNGFTAKFGISGWPTTIVIDRYGAIARIEVGAITSTDAWIRLIKKYIGNEYVQTFEPGKPNESINFELAKPDIKFASVEEENAHHSALGNALLNGNTLPEGNAITWYGEKEYADRRKDEVDKDGNKIYEEYEYAWPFLFAKFSDLEAETNPNYSSDDYVIFASNGTSPATSDGKYGEREGKANSMSILYADVTVKAGQALTFEYFADTEANGDILYIFWDGRMLREISGSSDGWKTCYLYSEITAGKHTISITYYKDSAKNVGKDNVFISNLRFVDVNEFKSGGELEDESTDMLRGAGFGEIANGKHSYYVDTTLTDRYYHVNVSALEGEESELGLAEGLAGNDKSPLLLANLMNVTPWNNYYSISELIYAQDENTGKYVYSCIFSIDGKKKDYRGDIIRYLSAAAASEVKFCVPVDAFLQKMLVAFMKEVKKTARIAAGLSVTNEADYWHENEWLEICFYYSHYGVGTPIGNPIVGLMEETAIEVEADTAEKYEADLTRMKAPFPAMIYTFTPEESAVYKFESFIPDEDAEDYGAQIWLYDDNTSADRPLVYDGESRVRLNAENEQNFELYYYLTAGHKYYFELAFLMQMMGTYEFNITKIGQSYTELVPASLDLYTMVVDENGDWTTGEYILAGAVEYVKDEDGYFHAINHDGTIGDFIYLDVLRANTSALGNIPLNRLVDYYVTDPESREDLDYKMFDFRYHVQYHVTTDDDGEMVAYDPERDSHVSPYGKKYKDYTSTLQAYIDAAPTTGDYAGLIKVDQKIVDILTLFFELRLNPIFDGKIETALENEWLRFCWYNRTHNANNP
ncbi:MAG: redoxin domain-containing protein [Clostridia bacterium]|nr:redoxin domain-containing protein [Clostridia bacterium]